MLSRSFLRNSRIGLVGSLFLTMLLAGCSASKIVTQWSNPQYAEQTHSFGRIMVIGISDQTSIRRVFEDRFVQKLEAAGYNAVPSYRFIPEDGKVSQERLKEAVQRANADAALVTRLLRVEQRVDVSPGYYPPASYYGFHSFPYNGFYGWYSHAWNGYYEPARIYPYKIYISETTLYDFRKDAVVWSATVRTTNPDNFNEAVGEYAEAVIDNLNDKKILAAR